MSETLSCPAGAFLDTWVGHDWSEGLQIEYLLDRELLAVQTENSTYEIRIICGRTGDVLVRGGRFLPEWTPVRLAGSSLGGSFLKLRGVYVGFRMELHGHQGCIVTSHIRSIGVKSNLDEHTISLFSEG